MVAAFETPNSGQILLYGEDVVRIPPNRRDVNLVFRLFLLQVGAGESAADEEHP